MDFGLSDEQQRLRTEIDHWLDDVLPPIGGGASMDAEDEGFERSRTFSRQLAKRGWIAPAWPREYGGLAATPLEQAIFSERFAYRRAPTGLQTIPVGFVGPTLILYGTEEQKQRHLPGISSGEVVWCQGFSEPGSGSDLASLQTRAVRDGDSYVVNGQKIWTSYGHQAGWCILLTRTDPDAPKHKGITYLLLDMCAPGVTVRPLINLAGRHGFNEVFLEDVRIPVENRVGEENRGWYVATTTLDFERSSISGTAVTRRMLNDATAALRASDRPSSPATTRQLVDLLISCDVGQWLSYRVAWLQTHGKVPNYEASVAKVFSSELAQRAANAIVNAFGPLGQLRAGMVRAPIGGLAIEQHMQSLASTIAGGTSEIQRNIIATRGLGLPRG